MRALLNGYYQSEFITCYYPCYPCYPCYHPTIFHNHIGDISHQINQVLDLENDSEHIGVLVDGGEVDSGLVQLGCVRQGLQIYI